MFFLNTIRDLDFTSLVPPSITINNIGVQFWEKSFLGLLGVSLFSFIYLSACENQGNSLEESVAPYLHLQAVDGARIATITVNRGEAQGLDSYFAIDLSNIDPSGFVSKGLSEGWCLDWSKPIRQNNDVHAGVKMFNTHGSENWKPANYLMNIKDDLQKADPSLTYKEIQVALWSLIKVPAFDIDQALREGSMPSRMITNGSSNFSVEKTKQIIRKVNSEVTEFQYKPGTPVIVYSNVLVDQQPVATVSGESAWSFYPDRTGNPDNSKSIEFCGNSIDSKILPAKWGWTNGPINNGDSGILDIYAGAAQCDVTKGTFVGTFSYTYENGNLTYILSLTAYNDFKDLHIHAGSTVLPQNGNGGKKYTGAPGQFAYGQSITSGIGETAGDIEGLSGSIYLAVHLGPM